MTGQKKAGKRPGEGWRRRRRDDANAYEEMTLQSRIAHAPAVGEPAGAEGRAGHGQIEGREKQADLGAGEPELLLIERRQSVDAVLRCRADDMGKGDEREDNPAE